jgi:hypothetical protein
MTHHSNSSENARLFEAYRETCFVIDAPGRKIDLRIGQHNPEADTLLKECGVTDAAFVTAWNPGSVRLSSAENDRRQQSLEEQIQSAGFRFLRGRGKGTDPSWIPEESVFIFGIPRRLAVALSSQFGQFAIVWHEVGKASILISVSK